MKMKKFFNNFLIVVIFLPALNEIQENIEQEVVIGHRKKNAPNFEREATSLRIIFLPLKNLQNYPTFNL